MTLLSSLTRSFGALRPFGGSPIASSSSSPLFASGSSAAGSIFDASSSSSTSPSWLSSSSPWASGQQVRFKGQLAPRRTKYRKAHKGRVPLPTGGSLKGTTLEHGTYGIRVLAPVRLSAKQLTSAEVALKRRLKVVKGAQVFLRVFPDIPVCVKGNETRMGKGKGTFEFWACRAGPGKVIFEVGGPVEIRPEVAKDALKLASAKLPVPTEFITISTPPRLGTLILNDVPAGSANSPGGAGLESKLEVTSVTSSVDAPGSPTRTTAA